MENKKIIIIGAGIAGMSAGCYGQMNGYDTEIYEMHDKHGGLCTAWKRKDYIIDGCYEWMIGVNPGSRLNKIWKEIGALQNKDITVHQEYCRCEFGFGKTIIFYSDADKLKTHLTEMAPEDVESVNEIATAIKDLAHFLQHTMAKKTPKGLLGKVITGMRLFTILKYSKKYGKISIQEYTKKRIKNIELSEAFNQSVHPEYTMLTFLFNLACYHNKDAGLPKGGSRGVVNSISERYTGLGGKINYKSPVNNIIIKGNKSVGIELSNGREIHGDVIISAADGHHTLFYLLGGQYLTETIKKCYSGNYPTLTSVQVSLGVNADLSNEARWVQVRLDNPVTLAGQQHKFISFYNYFDDETMIPKGKSVIVSHTVTPFEYWEKFNRHTPEYREEKRKIADEVIKSAEKRFPSIKGKIEVVDVATPLTYIRYTNVWRGAYMTWIPTPKSEILTKISNSLPGLENFYMIGQWVSSPGTPGALRTGRKVIQDICKKEGKIFQTSVP
jgi:phytoene dehydrogenase-like protein